MPRCEAARTTQRAEITPLRWASARLRRRQRRPRPADRLRQGHAAARRPGSRRAGHLVGRARRTLGGHRAERCGQDVAAAHRRRDGAPVLGHGLCARRTAGPGRHVRTARARRAEQLGAVADACPTGKWCATSSCRRDTRCSAAGGSATRTSTTTRPSTCWKASAPNTWPSAPTRRCRRANANAC